MIHFQLKSFEGQRMRRIQFYFCLILNKKVSKCPKSIVINYKDGINGTCKSYKDSNLVLFLKMYFQKKWIQWIYIGTPNAFEIIFIIISKCCSIKLNFPSYNVTLERKWNLSFHFSGDVRMWNLNYNILDEWSERSSHKGTKIVQNILTKINNSLSKNGKFFFMALCMNDE